MENKLKKGLTSFGSKADIVMFVYVTKHKPVAAGNITLWADDYVMVVRQTADHVNAGFIEVCHSLENHVVTPCANFLHVSQVMSPRWIPMNKVEQFRPISL